MRSRLGISFWPLGAVTDGGYFYFASDGELPNFDSTRDIRH